MINVNKRRRIALEMEEIPLTEQRLLRRRRGRERDNLRGTSEIGGGLSEESVFGEGVV